MAELASGAVTSLLGVIRSEWRLLGRVGGDVQFIREEMESMNSFLMHLARTTPPDGEHDEQVRTWMNQVRVLAHDCNNCIDLYLYRGNPDIHLGRDRLRRYLRWVPWFLQKMVAQHRAALELSVLKERARDVGKRRLRYGVEVPKKAAAAPVPGAAAEAAPAGAQGSGEAAALFHADDVEDGGHDQAWATAADPSGRIRKALFGLYVQEDYFSDLLTEWIEQVRAQPQWSAPDDQGRHDTRCVAFVVHKKESAGIARQASAVAEEKHVKNTILVDIPSLHRWSALGPKNVLYYILREIELKQQKTHADAKSQEWWRIRGEKRTRIKEIKEDIKNLKVMEKIEEIKTQIEKVKDDNQKLQPYLSKPKRKEDYITKEKIRDKKHALPELLVLLLISSGAADQTEKIQMATSTLATHYDVILKKAAKSLKEHMEQVNSGAAEGKRIIHNVAQYASILQEVFPMVSSGGGGSSNSNSNSRQPQDAQEQEATTEATPGKIQIREIIDKVKQDILSEVFMAIGGDKAQEATKTDTTTTTTATKLDEAQVKKMIQEAIQQLKEEKPADKKQETGVSGGQGPTKEDPKQESNEKKGQPDNAGSNSAQQGSSADDEAKKKAGEILGHTIKETTEKMKVIQKRIKRQLDINGIVAKIRSHLKRQDTLIILRVDAQYVSEWEKTRSALSLLPRVAVVMILTKTERNLERARKEYCHPEGEPIDYTCLAAFYHHIALEITGLHQKSASSDDDAQQIWLLRAIFDKCEPYFSCMKLFAQTLYARPRRSKQELEKLDNNLEGLQQRSYRSVAMKMLKFSYRDMPKEYQSCLLYLAIFPRGHRIRRSTLIGRWVAERMVTTEDWRWSSAVRIAEQCFDALVTRGLVYPAGTSATGRVKSCMVGDLAYDFITKMAKKQRILEPRLSHHLACYFSIFSDIHLRVSEKISDFLDRLSGSSQWPRLKVLDLEGCKCFRDNRLYLKNICNKIVLLKYLSLRRTDVDKLPQEINNLRELEVLDIQQTEVPASCTRNLLLLKLKRLLAGNRNPSRPRSTGGSGRGRGTSSHVHVLVPGKIDKMSDMEVLSNVRAKSDKDLDGIGKLWQLRKLGVVINVKDKDTHLMNLLQAISNLHECLQSLSITLDATTSHKGAPSPSRDQRVLEDYSTGLDGKKIMVECPKVLESLSISGDVHIPPGRFLPSELTDKSTPLIKLTLSNTLLTQDDLVALTNLHMLRCLKLRHNTYTGNKLTFKQVRFEKLKYFLVEGSNWIEISFEEDTAAPELVKIVLCFENIESIAGVDRLKKLEKLELNKYNKGSDEIDTSPPPPAVTKDPVPSTATGPDPAPSAPTGGASASAATADSVPSSTPTASSPTTTTTDNAVNPTPSTKATSTNQVLLPELLSSAKQVSKVTLCGTMLKQGDLRALARMENIRCLVLLHGSYGGSQLDVNKDDFPRLNVLVVSCPTVTGIKFEDGSSPQLEKLVWTFAEMKSFSGIENLTRLRKLEFVGHSLPHDGTQRGKFIFLVFMPWNHKFTNLNFNL